MKNLAKIICIAGLSLAIGNKARAQVIDTIKYSGAIATWTVPTCVTQVTITAVGATGGQMSGYTVKAGKGAKMVGTFTLSVGEVIKILAGGAGGTSYGGGGGGGGSFVTDNSNNPLIVAGGGGGIATFSNTYVPVGQNAVTSTGGVNGYSVLGGDPFYYGVGGVSGDGATNYSGFEGPCGGNGGGLLTSGQYFSCCFQNTYGIAFISGGNGGQSGCGAGGIGGFGGGGGGGYYGGGGGGGYSGGGGAYNIPTNGGGGGSYNGGSNQVNIAGYDSTGNGYVVLTYYVDSVATLTTNVISNVICNAANNGVACAVTTGAPESLSTYSWAPGGQTTDTVSGLSNGTYTVTVGAPCGLSKTATVTITQPNPLTLSGNVITDISCNGLSNGNASAVVGGGTAPYTYAWTGGAGTKDTASALSAGIYKVVIMDHNGCSNSTTVTITQPNVLTLNAMNTSNASCGISSGSALADVGGGTLPYTYSWTGGNTTSSISGLSGGTYMISIMDKNGCSQSSSVTISETPAVFTSASTTSNVTCNGDRSGSVTANVSGGTGPFTFSWSGNAGTNFTANGLGAGTYTVNVTDANGCSGTALTTITQPAPLSVTPDSTVDHGGCTGSAWVTVTGGVQPYNYSWSNGSTTYRALGLCKGEFCCTITDANGCVDNICIQVKSTTGIDNIGSSGSGVTIYPNPNNGQFTVESSIEGVRSVIEVYNVLGEKVYSTSLSMTKGAQNSVNISSQPNGVYLYRIVTESGDLITDGKMILQK